jgi:hypothetical protein
MIPEMRNVHALHINLDVLDESVVASLHRNLSIQRFYLNKADALMEADVKIGPVFEIMQRNRWLACANKLLDSKLEGLRHWPFGPTRLNDSVANTILGQQQSTKSCKKSWPSGVPLEQLQLLRPPPLPLLLLLPLRPPCSG